MMMMMMDIYYKELTIYGGNMQYHASINNDIQLTLFTGDNHLERFYYRF